jgi:hypothetical protein
MPWLGLIEQLDVILRGKFKLPKVLNATEVLHNIIPDILHLIRCTALTATSSFQSSASFFCSSSLTYCVIVSLLLLTANQNRGPQ